MHSLLSYDLARQVARDRQAQAAAYSAVRRHSRRHRQHRAEAASYRARLVRLAVR